MQKEQSKIIKKIPVFPLPNVVFFPKTFLPLHIFEPRYRKMVRDALDGANKITMVLLREGWETDYFGSPAVHEIGCIGDIQFSERLEDGKYDIMLYGLNRVRILDFVQDEPYRVANVEILRDRNFDHEDRNVMHASEEFLRLVKNYMSELGVNDLDEILRLRDRSFESIINQVASFLDIPPPEKQFLLAIDSLESRFERVSNLLEDRLFSLTVVRKVKHLPEQPRWN